MIPDELGGVKKVKRTYLPDGTVYELTAYCMTGPTCRVITDMNALQTELSNETPLHTVDSRGRIQDLKLGGALKIIAPSGVRCEILWGISCEKS